MRFVDCYLLLILSTFLSTFSDFVARLRYKVPTNPSTPNVPTLHKATNPITRCKYILCLVQKNKRFPPHWRGEPCP